MSKEVLGGADDLLTLLGMNRIGTVERFVVTAAGLDLDENQHRPLGGDQVDLAQVAAVVTDDDPIAPPPEVPRRDTLTERAEGDPITRRRPAPQQVPKARHSSCDPREVHAACEPCRFVDAGSTASPGGPGRDA